MSYPHVDHDPFHNTAYAEEYREESVGSETAFTRHKTEYVPNVFTPLKHLKQRALPNLLFLNESNDCDIHL